eukprot:46116-Alexandrium_andersonii.AAC.1
MSAPSPPEDGEPVAILIRFKPTLPCQETRGLVANLPSDFKERHARQIECQPHELQVLAALDLPDCGIAREYMAFQNHYIQTNGPNNAVPPYLSVPLCPEHLDTRGH